MTDQGTLVEIGGKPALRFERRYEHPMERVWRAVSDPGEMAKWFPSNVEGERAIGAELSFVDEEQRAAARDAGEPTRAEGPTSCGRVVAYDPPKVFSFTWGGELLRFELHAEGAATVLVFTQLLSHRSVAARNGSGWHMCLGMLDALLGARAPEPPHWNDVYDDYVARMGPELGMPAGDGAMSWERSTHVEPERVRAVTSDREEIDAWGGAAHRDEAVSWDIFPTETGTIYRLTHHHIGNDPQLAAEWHALLVQLDMYLAAGQLLAVEPAAWVGAYRDVLR